MAAPLAHGRLKMVRLPASWTSFVRCSIDGHFVSPGLHKRSAVDQSVTRAPLPLYSQYVQVLPAIVEADERIEWCVPKQSQAEKVSPSLPVLRIVRRR